MSDLSEESELVRRALAGDRGALRPLVDVLVPVVQARVARAMVRSAVAHKQGRDLRQDMADFMQEVFVALFADRAKALRSWDPTRGCSLRNFVGLLADHQMASRLRSSKRNPWTEEPTACNDLDRAVGSVEPTDARIHSRELLTQLLDRLRAELTPRNLNCFHLLMVEERTIVDVCEATGMTTDAVYAFRSRLGKLVRRLVDELEPPNLPPDAAAHHPGSRGEERTP
jgi:RNA polymerase sigma-70 factor (ECF subfamily)